ncbi:hypothetical protein [Stenotrophomonas sp.]|uniref:hypothetical protein n=1 Tax=Stenotrophomonas sp. TaxID=69392 RepID=UPI002FCC084F
MDPKLKALIDRSDLDSLLSPPPAPFREVVDPSRPPAPRPTAPVLEDTVQYRVRNPRVRGLILIAAGGPMMLMGMMLLELIWTYGEPGRVALRAALTVIPALMIGYLPYELMGRRRAPRRAAGADAGAAVRGPRPGP